MEVGDYIPWRFSPGLVVASFFASLLGTVLTVELLHRKRLGNSIASRLQLLSCAAAMGLIGIWCMHFIGNRSIILGDGSSQFQLTYSAGWTVLSCFLPVLGLSFAFYLAEVRCRTLYRRLLDLLAGVLAGLSIVGMHYIGNLGTNNYHLVYPSRYIVAACIIAIGDSIIALNLFFYFKDRWISVFWKRLVCAFILAVAVCGMHYTASVGCSYQLRSLGGSTDRNTAVIVAGVLCFVAACAVLGLILYSNIREKQLASRAQQINLACAFFDHDGNVLVNNEGMLPTQKIAQRFNLQRLDEDFNTNHPIFHWIWKVTNDWTAIKDFIPGIKAHLRRLDLEERLDEEAGADDGLLFRMSFCVAASELAARLGSSLDQLGILFDRVTGTGITGGTSTVKDSDAVSIASCQVYERGQSLFFTQILRPADADRYTAAGFRLAPVHRIEPMLARVMQMPLPLIANHMQAMLEYATGFDTPSTDTVKEGTYLTCFAALGRITRQFDVLVNTAHQSQLPDIQLAPQHLDAAQLAFVSQYDGWTAGPMVTDLKQQRQNAEVEMRGFVMMLISSMDSLARQISEAWFNDLTFAAEPIICPYGKASTAPTMIFGLTSLLDIHQGLVAQPERLAFVPLDFFRVRNAFFPGSVEFVKFRSQVHVEFEPFFTKDANADVEVKDAIADVEVKDAIADVEIKDGTRDVERTYSTASEKDLDLITPLDFKPIGGILATTNTVVVESVGSGKGPSVAFNIGGGGKTFADKLYEQAKSRGLARSVRTISRSASVS